MSERVLDIEPVAGNALSRRLSWLWSRPVMQIDALVAALLVGVDLTFLPTYDTPLYEGLVGPDYQAPGAIGIAIVVAAFLPLLWRQRAPLPSLAATTATHALVTAIGFPLSWTATCAALYEVALRCPRRGSVPAAVAVGVACMAAYVIGFPLSVGWLVYTAIAIVVSLLCAWALGRRVRARRIREEDLRAQEGEESQRAVTAERVRVARELHDILAHSISVMVATAAGGRQVLDSDPQRAAEALASIEATGRTSMAEVRRLLGMLRGEVVEPDLAPQPGLDALDDLLGQVRAAGLSVSVTIEGDRRALDPSVDLAAYRILQEAFTNVLKHAGRSEVGVRLVYGDERLLIAVRDAGGGQPWRMTGTDAGTGLLGMRERALLVGGSLSAGPVPGVGFELVAELPLAEAVAAS